MSLRVVPLQSMDATGSRTYYSGGRLCARPLQREIFSAFQPIFSIAHQRVVGCEGLVREQGPNGPRFPQGLFDTARIEHRVQVDAACVALHVANFHALDAEHLWLFLNLDPVALCQYPLLEDFVGATLRRHGVAPGSVVIEILEQPIEDFRAVEHAVNHYRALGCMIAIDDFGAGHSNLQRIWDLRPDMVKLDRGMLLAATRDKRIRRSLPSIVTLLHETGCLVVAEGIETEDQALIAMDANVDLVQGFLFARPAEITAPMTMRQVQWENLRARLQQDVLSQTVSARRHLGPLAAQFLAATRELASPTDFISRAAGLLGHPRVWRCFVLDEHGTQVGRNVNTTAARETGDAKLRPMAQAKGASWHHRPYFRRAVEAPGELYISHPYLSVSDAMMCITLSIARVIDGRLYVACLDVADHDDVHGETAARRGM
ncbi:MAG: EAL domain-containing protein [Gammaproteobacteria bacterium]|nr:EAL domain-containing protein [Gammaproteobacteria bacterium]